MENQGKRYDLIASDFATLRNSFVTEKKYIDLFIGYLQPEARILDVGCGSGFPIADYLLNNNFQVTGVDASAALLKIAKEKCPAMACVYGDIRTVSLEKNFDAIIEWWCLFHLPKQDHEKMIERFAVWLKKGGFLEFTSGDREYENHSTAMLDQELAYYSLPSDVYEKCLQKNGFKIIFRENDQPGHMVWIAQKI